MAEQAVSLVMDLLSYADRLRWKQEHGKRYLFGAARRRWLVSQPEELVRQLLLHYLQDQHGLPISRMAVEKMIRVGELQKRFDLVVYDQEGRPVLLVECKAPEQPINTATLEQASRYNHSLRIPYLLVTNGQVTYCWQVDLASGNYCWMDTWPKL